MWVGQCTAAASLFKNNDSNVQLHSTFLQLLDVPGHQLLLPAAKHSAIGSCAGACARCAAIMLLNLNGYLDHACDA
jgi:hypothetical protein